MPWLLHTCGCSQSWCSESLKRINTECWLLIFLRKRHPPPYPPLGKMLTKQCFSVYINVCTAGNFVATKLWQNLCQDKKCLSRQKFCHNSILLLWQHMFVATKHLSQQKWYLWQLPPMILIYHAQKYLQHIVVIMMIMRPKVWIMKTGEWWQKRPSYNALIPAHLQL